MSGRRDRARRQAADFVQWAKNRDKLATAYEHLEIPEPELRPVSAEEAYIIMRESESLIPLRPQKSGNKPGTGRITGDDKKDAAATRSDALEPEPLPPGHMEIVAMRAIRTILSERPSAQAEIEVMSGLSSDVVTEALMYMLHDNEILIAGERRIRRRMVPIYALAGTDADLPAVPVDKDDIEGIVARYLSMHKRANFAQIRKLSTLSDAVIMAALHSLMGQGKVLRTGKANRTAYVWTEDG